MIKAIFFDIDGTLVSFKTHEVPAEVVKAINDLREKGIKVFIATGRHFSSINNLGDLQFDGYITLNGGYCFSGNHIIYKHHIPKEDIGKLLDYLQYKESFPCILVRENSAIMNFENETTEHIFTMLNFPKPPVGDLRKAAEEDVYQLIAFFDKDKEEEMMGIMSGCEATRWYPSFTDVVPAGSSKRIGIDKVIEYFGISLNETMAFGDGGNDITMLKHAGIGIALGNADDEVKNSADYVTTSVDDNGVVNALKHFGLMD